MTTYTAINAVRAFAISAVVTGSTAISIGYVVFNAAADAAVYAGSDSLWDLANWTAIGRADSGRSTRGFAHPLGCMRRTSHHRSELYVTVDHALIEPAYRWAARRASRS